MIFESQTLIDFLVKKLNKSRLNPLQQCLNVPTMSPRCPTQKSLKLNEMLAGVLGSVSSAVWTLSCHQWSVLWFTTVRPNWVARYVVLNFVQPPKNTLVVRLYLFRILAVTFLYIWGRIRDHFGLNLYDSPYGRSCVPVY